MRAPIRLATGGLLGRPVVFSDQSMQRLSGVNPALVDVLKETERRALQQGIKIEVSEGLRNRERQTGLVKAGKSQTMNSRHITGDAVDIFIKNPDGTANWDFEAYRPVADIAKQVAAERGVPDLVWGGDWRTLKDGVHFQVGKSNMPQTRMAGNAQGGQTVQRSTMNAPPGLLGGSEPKPTFWDKIPGGLLSDPDRRARLAMAFEGMTLNPNQALIGALADEVKDRRQTKAQEKAMNATVEWLKSQGRDDLAAAVSSGALTGSQAAQMAYQRPDPMEALNIERAQLEIEALRNPQAAPMSGIGKLAADLAAGRISQEEYDVALANMAPSGMTIESDGAGGFRMVQGPGATSTRPMTEGQSKDNVYATRAEGALRALEPVANALTSAGERALNVDPTGIVRNLQSDDFQVAQNAGQEFLQAILRKDTGAAITAQEQELYGQTYLPQPGDNAAVLEVKRQARARALEALRAGMNAEQIATTERALVEAAKRSGASQTAPARITGDEEYNALPSGAQFIGPDGKLRRKP